MNTEEREKKLLRASELLAAHLRLSGQLLCTAASRCDCEDEMSVLLTEVEKWLDDGDIYGEIAWQLGRG